MKDFDHPLPTDTLDYSSLDAHILTIVNSKGVRYVDLPTDKLSFMANALAKSLKENHLDEEEKAQQSEKLEAARTIIEFRNRHAAGGG